MTGISNEAFCSMEKLFVFCEHILDERVSLQEMTAMQNELMLLQKQSEDYQEQLQDQEEHSRSDHSKMIAASFLEEDRRFRDFTKRTFLAGKRKETDEETDDMDLGALYVEYLTGRARQSVREALIGALNLKLSSVGEEDQKETE